MLKDWPETGEKQVALLRDYAKGLHTMNDNEFRTITLHAFAAILEGVMTTKEMIAASNERRA